MRAGMLDRRMTLDSLVKGKGPMGDVEDHWVTLSASEPVNVKPIGGRELVTAGGIFTDFDTRFTMRFRDDIAIDTTCRITYNGDQYDIFSVAEIGRREGLEILAKRRTEGVELGG